MGADGANGRGGHARGRRRRIRRRRLRRSQLSWPVLVRSARVLSGNRWTRSAKIDNHELYKGREKTQTHKISRRAAEVAETVCLNLQITRLDRFSAISAFLRKIIFPINDF